MTASPTQNTLFPRTTCWSFRVLIPIIAAFAEWLIVLMQLRLTSQSLEWFSARPCKAPDECRCATLVALLMHVTSSHLRGDLRPQSLLMEAIRKLKWGRWAAIHKQHLKLTRRGQGSFVSRKCKGNGGAYSVLHVWRPEQNDCFAFEAEKEIERKWANDNALIHWEALSCVWRLANPSIRVWLWVIERSTFWIITVIVRV